MQTKIVWTLAFSLTTACSGPSADTDTDTDTDIAESDTPDSDSDTPSDTDAPSDTDEVPAFTSDDLAGAWTLQGQGDNCYGWPNAASISFTAQDDGTFRMDYAVGDARPYSSVPVCTLDTDGSVTCTAGGFEQIQPIDNQAGCFLRISDVFSGALSPDGGLTLHADRTMTTSATLSGYEDQCNFSCTGIFDGTAAR